MHRSRKFLILILILLLINVIFFTIWYPLGGRKLVRNFIAAKVADTIGAKVQIGDLHISDKQILIQDFSYVDKDSQIDLNVKSFRVRYNLYKLILSGFKLDNVISTVEVIEPHVKLRYYHDFTKKRITKKRKKEFKIPDLSTYFKLITLESGSLESDLSFNLKMQNEGILKIEENLKNIQLRIQNAENTKLKLNATTSLGGKVSAEGSLIGGRIDIAKAEIEEYKPLYLSHPDIQDFRTEINIVAHYSEPSDSSKAEFSGKALIWNTSAFAINRLPVHIPLINAETDGNTGSISISSTRIAGSSIEARLSIHDMLEDIKIDGSYANISLYAADIMPQLSGLVEGSLTASGSINEPKVRLFANSNRFAYRNWALEDISLSADYEENIASIKDFDARWQNQFLSLNGSFSTHDLKFNAFLDVQNTDSKNSDLNAEGKLAVNGIIIKPYPIVNLSINDVDVRWRDLHLRSINGVGSMIPTNESLLVDVDLNSADGYKLAAVGDVLSRHIALDAEFHEMEVSKVYNQKVLNILAPIVNGKLDAVMTGNDVWYKMDANTAFTQNYDYQGKWDIIGTADIANPSVSASLITQDALFNGMPANISFNAAYSDQQIKVWSFAFEDMLNLSAKVMLTDLWESSLDIALRNIDSAKIMRYYPDASYLLPEFSSLSLFAQYNLQNSKEIDSWVNLKNVDLLSIVPLSLNLNINGTPENVAFNGIIKEKNKAMINLDGSGSLKPAFGIALNAIFKDLKLQDLLIQSNGIASLSGNVQFAMANILTENKQMEIGADIVGKEVQFGDFNIDHAVIKAVQKNESLIVDSLYVHANNLFTAKAHGSLDYNAIQNIFYEGDNTLELAIEGEFFPWLENLTDYIQESHGLSTINLVLGTSEDQFEISTGELNLDKGYIHLKDQVEPLRDIQIKGIFSDNRLMIQRGTFRMGNGQFYINNIFDSEPSDHFMVSFLDLGYFRILIEQPGIQATIPVVSPPKTLTNVAISGLDGRYAIVRGPFDDLKIEALVTASNLDILFPPGADNLLNLIMSVRNTGKKPDSDPTPLPFRLDLRLNIGENVRYVTYPTNLYLSPGGFLHLLYDGNRFIVEEANITSDRGSIDFFGTVFQVDNIAISMIDQQNILSVDGRFYKRTPDGSTIALTVTSSPEYDKGFFDRLQLNLTSDNPQDQNISQVLSRLRYNQNMDELPEDQKQNLLQDEALGLIGGNLNSTVLTPFFYPVENWIRRNLKLDGFSINAGFIQNIFSEYSSNPSQLADMADLSNLSSDITRFSSSILLNNLSVSMSKYIGYRMFIDYELNLQEATDLQKKTKLLVSHDTSLRLVLPRQYRLGYTLNYSPQDTGFTHEIQLQKSWRFWGL